ncbi:MAG: hypothetical protein RIB84_26970 [Sneathiellaceae bacterium]
MTDQKFRVDQSVYYAPDLRQRPAQGAYRIMRCLPADSAGFQYRIKSPQELHERVVREDQLSPAGT